MGKLVLFFGLILTATAGRAQTAAYFEQGTQEFGISNVSIGYSSASGLIVGAGTRYQYFVLDRVSLGGTAFYHKTENHEWMGLGPVASYILFTYENWFSRLDQQVTAAKFNGFDENFATFSGTISLSLNYLPQGSNFFVGAGFAHSYPLSDGDVLRRNTVQIFAGWFWN